jgi:hypothetical protein
MFQCVCYSVYWHLSKLLLLYCMFQTRSIMMRLSLTRTWTRILCCSSCTLNWRRWTFQCVCTRRISFQEKVSKRRYKYYWMNSCYRRPKHQSAQREINQNSMNSCYKLTFKVYKCFNCVFKRTLSVMSYLKKWILKKIFFQKQQTHNKQNEYYVQSKYTTISRYSHYSGPYNECIYDLFCNNLCIYLACFMRGNHHDRSTLLRVANNIPPDWYFGIFSTHNRG